jgi:hypothetical protein
MKGNIRERLYHLETPPPAGVWDRIALSLDEEDQNNIPVIPITQTKKANWQKWALAASLIGFVVMTGLWFAERGKKSGQVIVQEKAVSQLDSVNSKGKVNQVAEMQPVMPVKTDTVFITTPGSIIIQKEPAYITRNIPQVKQGKGKDMNSDGQVIIAQKDPSQVVPENGYIPKVVLRDSLGNVIQKIGEVRSSNETIATGPLTRGDKSIAQILSKISVNGDNEELDRIIGDSPYWKNKIQEWRNKIIRSGYTPNAVNLMGIPELLKIIEEEKVP